MKKAIAILAILATTGCVAEPIRQAETIGSVNVDVIAEFDGIRVYRFTDGGRFVYVARVIGAAGVSTKWSEHCGKGCTRDVAVQTLVTR